MKSIAKTIFAGALIVLVGVSAVSFTKHTAAGKVYSCLPCGLDCDKQNFSTAGSCPVCKMELVNRATIVFTSIQPSEICRYIAKHPATVLLDVRSKEEFEGKADPNFGTLQHAINFPIQEMETRLSGIAKLKHKEIIVYCSHSHRSPQVSYFLTQHGFTKIINMAGGMSVMTDKTCTR